MRERIDCGGLIRHLLRQGLTTKRIGDEIGLSQPSVSRLSTGRTRQTSAEAVVGLIRMAGGTVVLPVIADGVDGGNGD